MPGMSVRTVLACATALIAAAAATCPQESLAANHVYADAVDPFLGTDWGGKVFIGSTVPFGMVKVGPDMEDFDGHPSSNGYSSTGRILGFSHLHLSGASGKYGNILVAPLTGPLALGDIKSGRSDEVASVGYYGAHLTRYGIKAELTSTHRVGLHRYTFPQSQEAHITLNLDHVLNKGPGSESQKFSGGELQVVSNTTLEGFGRYSGGWGNGAEYKVYFHLVADHPARQTRTWSGDGLSTAAHVSVSSDQPIGATLDYVTTANEAVQVKVGISFVSVEQAQHNVETEMPDWSFAKVHDQAVAQWDQALARIKVRNPTDSQRRQLYTALYHTMLMPSERTGENPSWQSNEPYYDDYYTIWDTFRSSGPLLTLIAPERQRDIVRSVIDIYRHEGYMPDGRSGNSNGRTQGGSNADVMIADAFEKGMTGIDYETALAAMVKNAEVPPSDPQKEGRGGLLEYNSKGYISLMSERSGSRTVEYAYDDFALAEIACGLNHPAEAQRYAARAGNWENLWDPTLTQEGVQGFLRPKQADGGWAEPNLLRRGTWPDFFYEGDLWTYSLYAPQDVRKLIELSGGNDTFVKRLDRLFYYRHFDMSNEPGFLIPMLYDWAGRPDKAADIIVLALEREFLDSRGGIPGNDDSGAMSSWLTFQLLGIYPNAGQGIYLIGTPSFPEAEIVLAPGRVLHIIAHNIDSGHVNRYVQSATLNGAPLDTGWFRHAQIKDGGTLILEMGSEPSSWGTHTPPPSMSDAQSPLCAAAQPAAARQDDQLRLNEIQVIGTHNSYHAGIAPSESKLWQAKAPQMYAELDYHHPSLTAQLSAGVRQLELDVFADSNGGRYAHPAGPGVVARAGLPADPDFDPTHLMDKPGFKVMHVQDVDYRSVCQPLVACLREVRAWSKAHPQHVPVFLLVETKQSPLKLDFPTVQPEPFTSATFDALDKEILSVFPRDEIVTPDEVRGQHATLPEAIRDLGWPTLAAARGKVVFLMDQRAMGPVYVEGHPALEGRILFTNAVPGAPDAAFTEQNESPPEEIMALVRAGYLIRTRTDENTTEARNNDTRRRDAVLPSGAQILSTDYPVSEAAASGFSVGLPGGLNARCNTVLLPKGCQDRLLDQP